MRIHIIALLALAWVPTWAQNDIQASVNLQFRLTNPGARAQAMGGAFIGLADDTTAIFANPAGLVRMVSTTAVLEVNSTRRDNPIPFYQGRITQELIQDFSFDLETRTFGETTTSVPFFAYVQPKQRVKWGAFYAEQANFQRSFDTGAVGILPQFQGNPDVDLFSFGVFPTSDNTLDLSLRTLGFSAATTIAPGLSIGATVGFNELDYNTASVTTFDDPRVVFPEFQLDIAGLEGFIGKSFTFAEASGTDQQISFNAGVLYSPSDVFHLGFAYKRQPKFDYDYLGRQRVQPEVIEVILSGGAEFDVPDSYGFGFSFQPTDVAVLSAEVNRVLYSDLSDSFVPLFSNADDALMPVLVADDVTEYRVGFEYFFLNLRFPVAVRGGYWFYPYHALTNETFDTQIFFRYPFNEAGNFAISQRNTPFLQRFARDLNHLTFGAGITMGDVVIDFSGDMDEENASFSLSSIYRF